jgi:hypothetical protein
MTGTGRWSGARGIGLVEMLIAVTILSLVMAAMVGVLLQQQRFYLVANDAANTISVLERVKAILVPELMPLSPPSGDITYADADSIVLRAFRGVYAVCDKRVTTEVQITLRPVSGTILLQPDSALVFSPGARASVTDDHWKPVEIVAVSQSSCPDSTPGWRAVVPALAGQLSEVPIGAPVRVFRRARYWLEPHDGQWYVRTDALSGTPTVVGGPLAPTDSTGASVLRFRYLDALGNPVASLTEIRRIEIDVSAIGSVPTERGGRPMRKRHVLTIGARNAAP